MTRRRIAYDEISVREYSAIQWMLGHPAKTRLARSRVIALAKRRDRIELDLEVNFRDMEKELGQ